MKKWVLLIISVGVLAGCGDKKGQSQETNAIYQNFNGRPSNFSGRYSKVNQDGSKTSDGSVLYVDIVQNGADLVFVLDFKANDNSWLVQDSKNLVINDNVILQGQTRIGSIGTDGLSFSFVDKSGDKIAFTAKYHESTKKNLWFNLQKSRSFEGVIENRFTSGYIKSY